MKKVIISYEKLTNEILNLLVDKFPEGYDDSSIIRFKNHKDEVIEAVEVRTNDTIYLVKISTKLSQRMINYDEDDDVIAPLQNIKDINLIDEIENLENEEDNQEEDIEEKIEYDDEDDLDDENDIIDDNEEEEDYKNEK